MASGIRQLDAAELDMVAGGNAWTLVKVWAGAVASRLLGGSIAGAAVVTAVMGIEAAHDNPYVPDCSGGTGGCDSGTMQD